MEGTLRPGSIVVGVDTSQASMIALDWATTLAQQTRAPMHLIHGFSPDRPDWAFGMGADDDHFHRAGERVLNRARNRIQLRDRMIQVSTGLTGSYPAAAMVRASALASMVVVGSHGDSLLHISSIGETAHQIAGHAACPVAVVRTDLNLENEYRRILVGVDRSELSGKALGWAFSQAERINAEVLAIHAWQPRDAQDPGLGSAEWPSYADACREMIESKIADQRAQHPGVKVMTEVFQGNPTRALVTESHASDLVVLGARGDGGFDGLHLGRVARDALSHSTCPVVVMH
ncbi:universal stress protein [Leekyejoonella antrihumi]|nr:universal stress protein [Leekyejoonella antrihumi]